MGARLPERGGEKNERHIGKEVEDAIGREETVEVGGRMSGGRG